MKFRFRYNFIVRACCILLLFVLFLTFFKHSKFKISNMVVVGQWRNTFIKIIKHGSKNTDPVNMVGQSNQSTPDSTLSIKTINTIFNANSTYQSAYKNTNDSVTLTSSGTWIATEDSVILKQTTPVNNIYKFALKIQDSLATIKGIIDLNKYSKTNEALYCELKKYR